MNEILINDLMGWLNNELKKYEFAELGFILTVHAGQVKRIEKKVSVKLQC